MSLPPFIAVDEIKRRLPLIFPKGTANRQSMVNLAAARTLFVAVYAGAVEGTGIWIRPD